MKNKSEPPDNNRRLTILKRYNIQTLPLNLSKDHGKKTKPEEVIPIKTETPSVPKQKFLNSFFKHPLFLNDKKVSSCDLDKDAEKKSLANISPSTVKQKEAGFSWHSFQLSPSDVAVVEASDLFRNDSIVMRECDAARISESVGKYSLSLKNKSAILSVASSLDDNFFKETCLSQTSQITVSSLGKSCNMNPKTWVYVEGRYSKIIALVHKCIQVLDGKFPDPLVQNQPPKKVSLKQANHFDSCSPKHLSFISADTHVTFSHHTVEDNEKLNTKTDETASGHKVRSVSKFGESKHENDRDDMTSYYTTHVFGLYEETCTKSVLQNTTDHQANLILNPEHSIVWKYNVFEVPLWVFRGMKHMFTAVPLKFQQILQKLRMFRSGEDRPMAIQGPNVTSMDIESKTEMDESLGNEASEISSDEECQVVSSTNRPSLRTNKKTSSEHFSKTSKDDILVTVAYSSVFKSADEIEDDTSDSEHSIIRGSDKSFKTSVPKDVQEDEGLRKVIRLGKKAFYTDNCTLEQETIYSKASTLDQETVYTKANSTLDQETVYTKANSTLDQVSVHTKSSSTIDLDSLYSKFDSTLSQESITVYTKGNSTLAQVSVYTKSSSTIDLESLYSKSDSTSKQELVCSKYSSKLKGKNPCTKSNSILDQKTVYSKTTSTSSQELICNKPISNSDQEYVYSRGNSTSNENSSLTYDQQDYSKTSFTSEKGNYCSKAMSSNKQEIESSLTQLDRQERSRVENLLDYAEALNLSLPTDSSNSELTSYSCSKRSNRPGDHASLILQARTTPISSEALKEISVKTSALSEVEECMGIKELSDKGTQTFGDTS